MHATEEQRTRLAELVKRDGVAGFHRRTGMSREAITRLLAGLDVRVGTIAHLCLVLAENGDAATPAASNVTAPRATESAGLGLGGE